MCMHMYVCMYAYIHTYACTYCLHGYLTTCTYTQMYGMASYIHTQKYLHVSVHAYIHLRHIAVDGT